MPQRNNPTRRLKSLLHPQRHIQESQQQGTGWKGLFLTFGLLAAVAALWGMPLLVGVLLILAMLFLHELGHYLTAKWAGMKVTDFFVGFGPSLWAFRRGETLYGLKVFPLGAFVRIVGMTSLDRVDSADEHRTYRSKPYWRRMSVAVAGSAMHFLLALVLIFAYLVSGGKTERVESADWTVDGIVEGSPAYQAGVMPGDRIVAVNDVRVASMGELVGTLPEPGTEVFLTIQRNGGTFERMVALAPHPTDSSRGYIGAVSETAWTRQPVRVGYMDAAGETVNEFGFLAKESVLGVGRVFSPAGISGLFQMVGEEATGGNDLAIPANESAGQASGGLAGEGANEQAPSVEAVAENGDRVLSIFGVLRIFDGLIADFSEEYGRLLFLFAAINIFVGVFNLVPILPFDGGHVAIATYERIRSRRGRRYMADTSKMVPLAYAAIAVLLVVSMSALYLDAADPVQLPG